MSLNLKNSTNGIPTVDLEAELFEDIPNDLYVSATKTNTVEMRFAECKECIFSLYIISDN